jgi:hypothetical protein
MSKRVADLPVETLEAAGDWAPHAAPAVFTSSMASMKPIAIVPLSS